MRSLSIPAWVIGVMLTAASAIVRSQGDVFSGNGTGYYSARGAVLSLRQDAANGTGAPQLALDPDYPPSLPDWQALKRRAPGLAALFEDCAVLLIQATSEIKQVAPLMRARGRGLKTINGGIAKAKDLIRQGDACIAKVDQGGGTRLQGGVTTQTPGPRPPKNGGKLPPIRGGTTGQDRNEPGGQDTITGGVDNDDDTPQLKTTTEGYPAPHGFRQPEAPNYVCYDRDGYPYTVMVDPGAEKQPHFGVTDRPRIPPERVGYDECINPHPPKGCPPNDVRRTYRPIRSSDACNPPPNDRRPKEATVPVFHYYYVNGINTPEHDGDPPAKPARNRGSYDWDWQLIAGNLLGLGPVVNIGAATGKPTQTEVAEKIRVARNERNVFEVRTYNYSGTQPYLEGICRDGQDWFMTALCAPVREVNKVRGGGLFGMAGGDIRECAAQALWRESIDPAVENDDLIPWVRGIIQIHRNATANNSSRSKHYFILIGHSQGNFLVEGMAWRLLHLEGNVGREIFNSHLAILALASPTDYPSLWERSAEGAALAQHRMRHATRADDAILALRTVDKNLPTKKPFPATLPALWTYKPAALPNLLRLTAERPPQDKALIRLYSPMLEAIGWGPDTVCKPGGKPECNHALYMPLMNAHLIDNYLTNPTLTRPGQALSEKIKPYLDMDKMRAPYPAVLDEVRERLRLLKAALLQTNSKAGARP